MGVETPRSHVGALPQPYRSPIGSEACLLPHRPGLTACIRPPAAFTQSMAMLSIPGSSQSARGGGLLLDVSCIQGAPLPIREDRLWRSLVEGLFHWYGSHVSEWKGSVRVLRPVSAVHRTCGPSQQMDDSLTNKVGITRR
jgi:hypothetical protein